MRGDAALDEVRSRTRPGLRTASACPSCGQFGARVIYRAASVPVHSCVLLDSAAEARAFPRRDLELAFCETCGFVFNHLFDKSVMRYSMNFEESQHFSDTFSDFARKLAREIAEKCDVMGKQVLEIGCGKGEFLAELCALGGAHGVGIDPGYRADKGRGQQADVRYIVDFYGPRYKVLHADVILCRHTLEHIPDAQSFVRMIRESIEDSDDISIVFETPDALRVLREGAFWDIYYEHCCYFSAGTHARLFRREGFDVTGLSVVYDDQYIVQYARPAAAPTEPRFRAEFDLPMMSALAEAFPTRVNHVKTAWQSHIAQVVAQGDRIVLWGGGSKGVSFLTTLGLDEEIAAVVDVNPYKQGKFMPGTGHQVVAPAALEAIRPDVVILMNPIYAREVQSQLDTFEIKASLLAV
jgi:SAM-dependent methyltransferase